MSIRLIRREGARPAEHRHARRAAIEQRSGAGRGRGAAGVDVIHQNHVAIAYPRRPAGGEAECTLHGAPPPYRAEPAQHRSRAVPLERRGGDGEAAIAAERGGDQPGLIVSARPQTPAVERHGDDQLRTSRQVSRHEPRRRLRERGAPAIFQPQRHRPRDGAVGDRSVDAGVARRIFTAGGAMRVGSERMVERRMTGRAPRRTEEMERSPAFRAEAVIRRDDGPATRAARRQRHRDDRGEQLAEHGRVVARVRRAHKPRMSAPEIFDRAARRQRRDRAAPGYAAHDFLRAAMLDGIAERLESVKRDFADVLDLGCFDGAFVPPPGARVARLDAGYAFARGSGGVQGDEDRLPFADASFDLVVSAGVLDQVNDVPGALALARRVLRPDGLFLAAFVGAGSLSALRAALRVAEGERPAPRLHPLIDVRSAGDLLMRAGFALPVADVEALTVRYAGIGRLLDDLRGMAAANVLRDRRPLTRATLTRMAAAFAEAAGPDGRTSERFDIVFLTGWAPSPDQPKPARRGSGTASLAAALKKD